MTVLKRLGLALAPAALLGAYAWFPALAFVTWFALVPWILLYADDRRDPAPVRYYALGAYVTWVLNYPQGAQWGWFVPLFMAAVCFWWWIPFAPVVSRLRHRLGMPLVPAVALAWTATEWLRATFTTGHLELYGIGYAQARYPAVVQFADLTGSYGVSFLVAAVNGLVALVYLAVRDRGWRDGLRSREVVRSAVAIAVGLVAVLSYGGYRLATVEHEPGPRLALIQPNAPHTQRNMIGVHLTQLLQTMRSVSPGDADLVVWPENAIVDNIRRPGAYLEDLAWMAEELDAWLVVGAFGKSVASPGRTTNSAWLIDDRGAIRDTYAKQILFPWSEYIPGDEIIGRVAPRVQRIYRWLNRAAWGWQPTGEPGTETRVFDLPWNGQTVRFAPLICFENAYPPIPAEAGGLGADFFLHITSEGSVGGPVQEQLLRIAMLRAIENRMSYVRVGNTGISGVVDALGRVRAILRGTSGGAINVEGTLLTEVPLSRSPRTVFARSGNAFVNVVVVVTAILVVGSFFRRRRPATPAAVALAVLISTTGCGDVPSLEGDPSAVDASLVRGAASIAAGDLTGAIEPLAAACATEEGCRLALPSLLAAYDAGIADDEAAILFGKIAEKYPSQAAEALSYRAVFLNRTLDLRAARATYEESLRLQPNARVYGRLGNVLMRMEDSDAALEAFEAGLAVDPDNLQLRFITGRAHRIRGEDAEALELLEAVLEVEPTHGSAWTNVARIRLRQGDEEGGRQALRTAVRVEPTIIEARYLLARLALRDGDLDRVEELIQEIRDIEDGLGRGPERESIGS